jgi:hypothetical protein
MKLALALSMIVTAASVTRGSDRSSRSPASYSIQVSGTTITVSLRWNATTSKCEIVDPGKKKVTAGRIVRWHYKNTGSNKCPGKHTLWITPLTAPIAGYCSKHTDIDEDSETDNKGDCLVDPQSSGTYKYKVDGDPSLDPELDIQPPPFEGKKEGRKSKHTP